MWVVMTYPSCGSFTEMVVFVERNRIKCNFRFVPDVENDIIEIKFNNSSMI